MSQRRFAASLVAVGLFGVVGCATTAKPMMFSRNRSEPPVVSMPHTGMPAGSFVGDGPMLDGGMTYGTPGGVMAAPAPPVGAYPAPAPPFGTYPAPPNGTVPALPGNPPPPQIPYTNPPPQMPYTNPGAPPLNPAVPVGPPPRTAPQTPAGTTYQPKRIG